MGDFNSDWKITGTPDPATPDPQPHQQPAQPAAPVVNTQPVYQTAPTVNAQPVYQPAPAYNPQAIYQGAPVQQVPAVQASGRQQIASGFVPAPQQISRNADLVAERETNLNEINKMINHFSPKVDVFQNYEICINDIMKCNNTSVAPFCWGIILALHSLIFVFSAATSNYRDNILLYAGIALGFALVGAAFIVLYFVKKKKKEAKLEDLYVRFEELSNELKIIYNGYSNCVLPQEYTDPRILFKIQSMLFSGRYFSIGNALNSLLGFPGVYMNITKNKAKFIEQTKARYNGNPAFFNAVRYLNLR